MVAFVNSRTETRAADLKSIGIDPEQGRVYLNRLAERNSIQKIGRGLYKGVTTVTTVISAGDSGAERNTGLDGECYDDAERNTVTNVTPLFQDDAAEDTDGTA